MTKPTLTHYLNGDEPPDEHIGNARQLIMAFPAPLTPAQRTMLAAIDTRLQRAQAQLRGQPCP